MHTQVVIVLLGILFFATTMQGRQPSDQERHESKHGTKRYFIEAAQKLRRQKVRHLRQQLEHHTRDSDDRQQQFRQEMLEAHNFYRGLVCSSPLTLDDNLNDAAQKYAEHLAQLDSLKPEQTDLVGQNLYVYNGSDEMYTVEDVSAYLVAFEWFVELTDYDFDKGGFSPSTSHFTQLVWNSTHELGVGIALNDDHTKAYVAALYLPPGNQEGQYQDNVALGTC